MSGVRYSKVPRNTHVLAEFRAMSGPQPNGQSLYLRLLCGPELTNVPGLFAVWPAGLAQAMRWSLEGFQEAFWEVARQGLAEADWDVGLVWVPGALATNRPESPNVVKSWRGSWAELPDCPLKAKAHRELEALAKGMGEAFLEAFTEACPTPSAKPSPNQDQDQDQDQEQKQEVLALTRPAPVSVSRSKSQTRGRAAKHSPAEIAAKQQVVDAFVAAFEAAKGCKPDLSSEADHAAAFTLAHRFGVEEARSIIARALHDEFVLNKSCTLRYVASKADSWRGKVATSNGKHAPLQPSTLPAERAFQVGRNPPASAPASASEGAAPERSPS